MTVAYMHTSESKSGDECQNPSGCNPAGSSMINDQRETNLLDDILYTVVTIVTCVRWYSWSWWWTQCHAAAWWCFEACECLHDCCQWTVIMNAVVMMGIDCASVGIQINLQLGLWSRGWVYDNIVHVVHPQHHTIFVSGHALKGEKTVHAFWRS